MSENMDNFLRFSVRNSDHSISSLPQLKSFIDKNLETKLKKISSERIKLKVSRGLWNSDKRLVEVIVNKNLNQSMISTINSIKYLEPFEALYLMESHCLEVLFNEIPLSIEESFKLFLQSEDQINVYRIFATLLRSGYFVKKHIPTKICDLSSNSKRKLSESECDFNKKFESNLNYYELSAKIANYKFIKNMRTISPMTKTEDQSNDTKLFNQKSIIYEIEDNESPIELDPRLTLFNGDIKPLCDLGILYSNQQLFNLIQSYGPKFITTTNVEESKLEITLDVFKNCNKKCDKNPNFNVIIAKSDEKVPQINDLIHLKKNSPSVQTCFAVLDSNDFVFYWISCSQINDEFPVLWQNYCKPIQ